MAILMGRCAPLLTGEPQFLEPRRKPHRLTTGAPILSTGIGQIRSGLVSHLSDRDHR